jgi:hypothetical protein
MKTEIDLFEHGVVRITQTDAFDGVTHVVRLKDDSQEIRMIARAAGPAPEACEMLVSAVAMADSVVDQLEEGSFYPKLEMQGLRNLLVQLAHELGVELP